MWNSMRVLAAAGPDLDRWTKYDVYAEQEAAPRRRNIVFTGPVPRDACIFSTSRWISISCITPTTRRELYRPARRTMRYIGPSPYPVMGMTRSARGFRDARVAFRDSS